MASSSRPLRVVLESARAPFSSRDDQGRPNGLAVDFWERWSRHAGVPLSIAVLPLYDALQAVRQGRADAILEFAHDGKAPHGLRLGPSYASLPLTLFFSRKLHGISDLQDLEGLRVGVVAASAEADILAERLPFGTVLVSYPTTEALVAGASLGEVHAFLAPETVAAHYLAMSGGLDAFLQLREPALILQVAVAVADNADSANVPPPAALQPLLRTMDDAMLLERRGIELAWRGERLARELPWRSLGAAVLVLLLLVVGVLLWNRQLQRRVRLATKELLALNTILQEEIRTRRNAEDELASLNRLLEFRIVERTKALGEKAAELQRANDRLRRMDEAKTAFLAAVSHELRTPLTSLRGFSKLIRKDFEKFVLPGLAQAPDTLARAGRILSNLAIMDAEGDRLTRLINDYLDLARIEAGTMPWRDEAISPGDCVQRAVQAVAGHFAEKTHLDLHVETASDLPDLHVDPDRLEQVLINLLSNAIKFTAQGHVWLRTSARITAEGERVVRFAVQDTGIGIPEADRERIFDKFERLLPEDTLQSSLAVGAGLGLSICKQIVENYGGRIWVEGERGSNFIVEIPVNPPDFATREAQG
ncbi:sensor histidine kinase [Megalodesulfovibrio paquesii]